MKSIVYVGMDVHKDTFSLCALDDETGEILGQTQCASDPKLVEKFIAHLADSRDVETEFLAGYEAGCLGYSLYRSLQKLGIACEIMAPTTMYSSAKNKMVKNDKMDAKMIARNLAGRTYHAVYVPDDEDDEVKEYIRLRKTFKKTLMRMKQQLSALILRHGFHYNETVTNWTQAHRAWIKHLKVSSLMRTTIDEYLVEIEELEDKLSRYDQKIEELSRSDRYVQPVQALRCLKGISTTNAMTIHVEIADFSRFSTAPAFMAYVGLYPSEHSSGNHTAKGAITKQGNRAVRSTLIEATQSLVKGHIGHKSKDLRTRQLGQQAQLIHYADKAIAHLQRRFRRMIERGKAYNTAIAAVARELAGYIWGIENGKISY